MSKIVPFEGMMIFQKDFLDYTGFKLSYCHLQGKEKEPMKKIRIFGVFFLAGVLLVACGAKGTLLGEDDAGRQVELAVGEKLLVTLESNPTTGFSWFVDEINERVLVQQGETEYEGSGPPIPGSGGTETFIFEAVGTGETTLVLIYHRPWEEGVDPIETYSVTIVVVE